MGASKSLDNCNLPNTCNVMCDFPWYSHEDIGLWNRPTIQQALILCYLKSAKNTGLLQPMKRFKNGWENVTDASVGGTGLPKIDLRFIFRSSKQQWIMLSKAFHHCTRHQNRWLCLFACLTTHAFHLEVHVAFGLDTDSFLNAFMNYQRKRFDKGDGQWLRH